MYKLFCIFSLLFLFIGNLSLTVFSQTNSKNYSSNLNFSTKEETEEDVSIQPLFGLYLDNLAWKTPKSEVLLDSSFILMVRKNFKKESDASKFFSDRGWDYFADNELDTAAYRFNLAYYFNVKNVESYWGLATIAFHEKDFEASAAILRKGLEIEPNNVMLMSDLAVALMHIYLKVLDKNLIEESYNLLIKTLSIDSTAPHNYIRLAVVEYHRNDFEASWANIHRCRIIDSQQIDKEFLQTLLAKKPDPWGIYFR